MWVVTQSVSFIVNEDDRSYFSHIFLKWIFSYSNGCQCKGNVDEEVCDLNSSEPVCKWVQDIRCQM